jgi:spore coat protein U-like protein
VKTKVGQRQLNLAIISAIVLGIVGLSTNTCADTTADMAVTANINPSCTLSTTDLDFGAYDAVVANATEDLTASAQISTTCTSGATGVVTMNQGDHAFYCVNFNCIRRMANAEETSFLRYQIYTNAGYSVVWNHDVDEMSSVASVIGTGVSQNLTVFGEVPKNQRYATAGRYSDLVSITLTY